MLKHLAFAVVLTSALAVAQQPQAVTAQPSEAPQLKAVQDYAPYSIALLPATQGRRNSPAVFQADNDWRPSGPSEPAQSGK
jgi:hypothetical protein